MAGQDSPDDSFALRQASTFFEKFDKYECQELLSFASTHFLLSTDDFKVPTEPPLGVITGMQPIQEFLVMFLMPVEEGIELLDLREVHQIIRELTFGIFVLNQMPSIALEVNFDESTSCQLPPAYIDTRVGQILINVDYYMKALWHGAYFPREKRSKFSERWRGNLDVNSNGKPETKKPLLPEFTSAGMLDVASDPDYADIYSKLPAEQPGDVELAEEKRFFMSHVDGLSMQLTLHQNTVQQHRNLFVIDPDYLISSVVHLTEDRIDKTGYERLNARLQLHEILLKQHLPNKEEIRKQLYLLKLISFLVPFLVGMKKRMRIPDLGKMLPNLTGDECKTERELPPLMLGPDFTCKNFNFGNRYFNLHGGVQVDFETPDPKEPSEEVIEGFNEIKEDTVAFLKKWLDPNAPLQETYPAPTKTYDGKEYYTFALDFETYYPQSPQKPKWVHVMCEEIEKLKPKRLPVLEGQLFELFKKYCGLKKAMKYKNVQHGLKAASQRGLIAAFHTLSRKCPPARLAKQDEVGMGLVHYAAMFNRPNILAICIMLAMDVNVKRNTNFVATGYVSPMPSAQRDGPSPLHLAARCGAYDACSCLLANYANILGTDNDGWTPVHHAAYFDHVPIIKLLIRKNDALLELQTKNDVGSTPLLLAASSGALAALRCLLDLGAYILRVDEEGNNLIHLAALRFHTNILEYFIQWNHPDIDVWEILVGMLSEGEMEKKDAAVKCLEPLSTSSPDHWKAILNAGGVAALVAILKVQNEDLQSVAASVLCNISENDDVRQALTEANAGPILISLLGSHVDEIQSRAAIVLSDLASIGDNQDNIAEQGGLPALVHLLDSELEDVLVNAVEAVRVMCTGHPVNQLSVAQEGGIDSLVEFLTVNSDILQAASSAAIAALCKDQEENQNAVMNEGAIEPLVNLIKGRKVTVQVKAASALEAMADDNAACQRAFIDLEAPKALMKLLKVWSLEVKEQGACALWALAGQTKKQQKDIAEMIGISQLIEVLLLNSEKLQYVGCMGMTALGREDMESQNRIAEQGGIQPLVRLLRSHKTSDRVLLTVIQVLGTLCVGVAHKNNKVTQGKIAEEQAIPTLVQLLVKPPSQEIQVDVAYTLGCVVLGNRDNQEKLKEESGFKFKILLDLLKNSNDVIRLNAGLALSIFAFNNAPQQYAIREAGGVKYQVFDHFLQSGNDLNICNAAFQVVVLARVIVDRDQVMLTASGVSSLVNILRGNRKDNAIILAASLMASLAHTRAGIPDAMTTVGAIDLLITRLSSDNLQVRFSCATALGYLTYNRTAARLLLTACRNTPGLYDRLKRNLGPATTNPRPKISPDFVQEFECAKIVGLPCLSLQMHGGPPIDPHKNKPRVRPQRPVTACVASTTSTTRSQLSANHHDHSTHRLNNNVPPRAKSAPANRQYPHQQQLPRQNPRLHTRSQTQTPTSQRIPTYSDSETLNSRPSSSTATKSKKPPKYAFFKSQLGAWEEK